MKISKTNSNPTVMSNTEKAISHIKCAIDLLGPSAKKDPVAREALINLGVVAVDLNASNPSRR